MENVQQVKELVAKITNMRVFTQKQTQYITMWVTDWGMSVKDILSAYDAMMDRWNKISFPYWNAVLKARYEEKLLKRGVKTMIFYDEQHEKAYAEILGRMRYDDCYHRTVAYLLGLPITREHIDDLFDFKESLIKREGLNKAWQTGATYKTTRLAFNLWNGCHYDIEGKNEDLSSCGWYTPEQIFVVTAFAPYYWQAIKLRFELDTEET